MPENNPNPQTSKGLKPIVLVLIVLAAGFIAGIGGEFFTRYYLSNLSFLRDLYFTGNQQAGDQGLIINEPKKVVVEQDTMANQVKSDIAPQVVDIYRNKSPKNLLDRIFLPADYLGSALILTSDGWLICLQQISGSIPAGLIVNYNGKNYPVQKIISDPVTAVSFLKIDSQNLPAVKIADWENISDGNQVYAYSGFYNLLDIAVIQNKNYLEINSKYDLVVSSENLAKAILLDKSEGAKFWGAPLVNSQSEIIGLIISKPSGYNQVLPFAYIEPIISRILKGEKVSRPYLGVNYIDLNRAPGLTAQDRQDLANGALVWPDETGIAVKTASPLAGKLAAGDIITKFEDQNIDSQHSLSDILLGYKTGQQITLKYFRNKQEGEVSIVLK